MVKHSCPSQNFDLGFRFYITLHHITTLHTDMGRRASRRQTDTVRRYTNGQAPRQTKDEDNTQAVCRCQLSVLEIDPSLSLFFVVSQKRISIL